VNALPHKALQKLITLFSFLALLGMHKVEACQSLKGGGSVSHYYYGNGGHVGGHLREAFEELVTGQGLHGDHAHDGQILTPQRLTGLLWNCTDMMNRDMCTELDMPSGSSYAAGARAYRAQLKTGE
jgi:hypothetical protein